MELKGGSEYGVSRRKSTTENKFWIKEERSAAYKRVSSILMKSESDRSDEEKQFLFECSEVVQEVKKRMQSRQRLKERLKEFEDPPGELAEKCSALASAIKLARHLVVYTGAGISTAACIPDYRGANGIWTLLQQGKDIGLHDLSRAEPTLTHMALSQLQRGGHVKHVVSQNCDGLHLRAALPRQSLSELHGNMYIEVCRNCNPPKEYWRLFDVTEHTGRFAHNTRRRCYTCLSPLVDTIVHFGERGTLAWPLNWKGACDAADAADTILCIGSSLRVLKKYPWLWCMDKPVKKRPNLYIVNLQWTPKDEQATLKINGRCDEVMKQVMTHLQIPIPCYDRLRDPIFAHATLLHPLEMHTTSRPALQPSLVEEKSLLDEDKKFISATEISAPVKTENISSSNTKRIQSTNIGDDIKYIIGNQNTVALNVSGDSRVCKKNEEAAENENCYTSVLASENGEKSFKKENDECSENKADSSATCLLIGPCSNILGSESEKVRSIKKENSEASHVTVCGDINKFGLSNSPEIDIIAVVMKNTLGNKKGKMQDTDSLISQSKNVIDVSSSEDGPTKNKGEQQAKVPKYTKNKCKVFESDADVNRDHKFSHGIVGRPVVNGSIPASSDSTNSFGAGLCHYCRAQRGSYRCLYYVRRVPVFANLTGDRDKTPVCECCEQVGVLGSSKKRRNSSNKDKIVCKDEECDDNCESPSEELQPETKEYNSVDNSSCPTVLTNPGWFGKGYRKRMKKKR
ncbi:NAD-dependent protein deacetylase sirtuin-7 [Hetaerina americana]|uniref:NAD-dependent protein deacetylase sirtuin-7 n=1 Tax=Hetaerina americana TaxID=62018 RepID=UPI003A7F3928